MPRSAMREPSTEHARLVLSGEAFRVEDIPEAPPQRRADLRAWWNGEEYVVEAKLRDPHARWQEMAKQSAAEGYASISRQVQPWNSLSSTIIEASNQLADTPAGPDAFRVLWVVALNDDDDFVIASLEKRLVGTELVSCVTAAMDDLKTMDCYYHASNDFERCPILDAAVLGTKRGANLFVNSFSPRRDSFRSSRLHEMFSQHQAEVDPEVRVQRGEALMLGADFVGPRNGKSQWAYLKDRFGVATSVMAEHQFAGMLSVPRSALETKD